MARNNQTYSENPSQYWIEQMTDILQGHIYLQSISINENRSIKDAIFPQKIVNVWKKFQMMYQSSKHMKRLYAGAHNTCNLHIALISIFVAVMLLMIFWNWMTSTNWPANLPPLAWDLPVRGDSVDISPPNTTQKHNSSKLRNGTLTAQHFY